MKKVQRINESQLRTIVAESVKKVLNEETYDDAVNLEHYIREHMHTMCENNPQAFVNAVNQFINELPYGAWQKFEQMMNFYEEN